LADIIILVMLAIGLIAGYKDGLVKGLFDIVGLILGVVAAISLTSGVVGFLETLGINQGEYLPIIVAIAIFVVVVAVLSAFAEFIKSLLKVLFLGKVDQLLGMVLGLAKSLLFVSILAWVFGQFGVFEQEMKDSMILEALLPMVKENYNRASERIGLLQSLNHMLETLFPTE
jgi:membrane protein required for colicin V production